MDKEVEEEEVVPRRQREAPSETEEERYASIASIIRNVVTISR